MNGGREEIRQKREEGRIAVTEGMKEERTFFRHNHLKCKYPHAQTPINNK